MTRRPGGPSVHTRNALNMSFSPASCSPFFSFFFLFSFLFPFSLLLLSTPFAAKVVLVSAVLFCPPSCPVAHHPPLSALPHSLPRPLSQCEHPPSPPSSSPFPAAIFPHSFPPSPHSTRSGGVLFAEVASCKIIFFSPFGIVT